jgi:hypothetical protein
MEDGELQLTGYRKKITPATQAALWTLSNGRCYAPECLSPVVMEIRPGAYRKNAQIAHIHGVSAPRYKENMTAEECAAFSNLLLLCLPHHSEVDDRLTGERFYPPDLLHKWKADHEGSNGPALAALGPVGDDILIEMLLDAFSPPLERLEQIADQLDATGTITAQTVIELRQVIDVMTISPMGLNARIASAMVDAAGVYGSHGFREATLALSHAADVLPGYDRELAGKISELHEIATLIAGSSRRMGGYM